jgi:cell division protein ZapE
MSERRRANLRDVYAREIRERGLIEDPAQLAAIEHMDDLRARLIAAHDRERTGVRGLIGRARRTPSHLERGLYMWGPVGRGKTWLMDLFHQSLPFPERRRRHFHRFMHDAHAELKGLRNRRTEPLDYIAGRIARETRVLCFDELAVTDIADAMILGGLLEGLFARGVTLVATSNLRPDELYVGGLQRERFLPTIARIEENVEVLHVAGATDYRLRQLTRAGTYLAAGAADTPERLAALFSALADGNVTTGTIEVEGRPIRVVRRSPGVVWFEFSALCAGARSQEDYIEIARGYTCVIVADVPVLDAAHDDETRRFIALVDELYDRNVNLVVSAAAQPGELYRGTRLAMEFERTASRLIEMQSEEYLARERRP